MPKHIYCSECGKELVQTLQAVRELSVILHLVEPHECGPKVDLVKHFRHLKTEPVQYVEKKAKPDDSETVQKLNELEELITDKRPADQVKTTAPNAILGMLDSRRGR